MARIIDIDKLSLKEMIENFHLYLGLPDGLALLPLPEKIKIGKHYYPIPVTLDAFLKDFTYGQRLFVAREEDNDFGAILRVIEGYYYPIVTHQKWDEDKAQLFGGVVLNCKVQDLYPVSMHLIELVSQMVAREQSLLHRDPKKIELAAGIEKLNVFSELSNLDFLRDAMKCTIPEVLLTPYNECLVRFLAAKETIEYQERYFELMKTMNEPKNKYHA